MDHMNRLLLIALSTVFLASLSFAQPPKREFRAAWVASVTNLDWPTSNAQSGAVQQADLKTMLDHLAQLREQGLDVIED